MSTYDVNFNNCKLPTTPQQKYGKTKRGEEEKTSSNSDVEPGAGKMRGAEGDDGGDEGHGWHPDRDGGAQVADVLLAQGGKSARDVRESDGDAVVAVAAQAWASVPDHRLLVLLPVGQHYWHVVFVDQSGAIAVGTALVSIVGREEGDVGGVVGVD